MWQMLLIPLSIGLLGSILIASWRDRSRGQKAVREPKGLKIKYPTAISPLSRK